MKKLLQLAVTERGVLSMEEELMVMQDTEASRLAASAETEEAERTIDIAEALEDLAFVASTIKRVTPREAALLQITADTAMAGTGVDGAVIAPALEAETTAEGTVATTQRIRDAIEKVVAVIKKVMASILEHARNFYEGVQRMLLNVEKRLADAAEQLKGLSDNANAGKINIHPLTEGDQTLSSPAAISKGLRHFADAMVTYSKEQGAYHFTVCSQMLQFYALVAQDKHQPTVLIQQLEKAINASDAASTLVKSEGSSSVIDNEGPATVVTSEAFSDSLLGGLQVRRKSARLKSFDKPAEASMVDIANLVGVAMTASGYYAYAEGSRSAERVDIDVPKVAELREMVAAAQALLNKVVSDKSPVAEAGEKARKLADRCNQEITKRLENVKQAEAAPLVNVAPRVTKHITEQATASYMTLTSMALRSIGQTLVIVNKAIVEHKPSAKLLEANTPAQIAAA